MLILLCYLFLEPRCPVDDDRDRRWRRRPDRAHVDEKPLAVGGHLIAVPRRPGWANSEQRRDRATSNPESPAVTVAAINVLSGAGLTKRLPFPSPRQRGGCAAG